MVRGLRVISVGVVITWALIFWWISHAVAKDPTGKYNNSPYKSWFESQHNEEGQSCCWEADGYAYYGDYTLNQDGSVTLALEEGPRQIPATKVLKGANPTGNAIWWHIGATDYCFHPGSLT